MPSANKRNSDPHQPGGLGSGGANFDPSWQGNADGVGEPDDNVASAIPGGCPPLTLGFTEGSGSQGWRIRFCENVLWDDGPGTTPSGFDIQGVMTHEYGHALGLDHSPVGGATMTQGTSGSGLSDRSLHSDDVAGVQAIYGTAAADKPRIDAVSITGGLIAITGQNFTDEDNQVWFTQAGTGGSGAPVKVLDVDSSAGGTAIALALPTTAGPGDVLVKRAGAGHAALSNAFPFDPGSDPAPPPPGPNVLFVDPPSVSAVVVDGPATVTLTGTGLGDTTAVLVDGIPLTSSPPQFTVQGDNELQLQMPQVSKLGPVAVDVLGSLGSSQASIEVTPSDPPALELADSDPAFLLSSTGASLLLGSDAGDLYVLLISGFDGPTPLPGLIPDLGIGGGDPTVVLPLSVQLLPPAGYVQQHYALPPGLTGTKLYLQGAVLDADTVYALPSTVTNKEVGTILF